MTQLSKKKNVGKAVSSQPDLDSKPLSPKQLRDRVLTQDIRDVLENDRHLSPSDISVRVRGGVAHLSGRVVDSVEKARLRQIVSRVRGIHAVWDILEIGENRQPFVLDIGCGNTKQHSRSVGVDYFPYENVDIVANLEKGLPIASRKADHVFAVHFLEHVQDLSGLMNEIHRVLKPDGILHVIVPYHQYVNAVADPTHVRFFHPQTFKFFCRPYPGLLPFRPLSISTTGIDIFADLQPVLEGEPLASDEELARFWD